MNDQISDTNVNDHLEVSDKCVNSLLEAFDAFDLEDESTPQSSTE